MQDKTRQVGFFLKDSYQHCRDRVFAFIYLFIIYSSLSFHFCIACLTFSPLSFRSQFERILKLSHKCRLLVGRFVFFRRLV